MIEVRNISKSFGGVSALKSIDCTIERGEIFGIVGPDGSGKSTLLRILSTIMQSDEGVVMTGGKNILDDDIAVKERIAYMPQRFGLYEDLTVEENIYFFGRLFCVPRKAIDKRITMLYDFSRLGPFRDRLAGKLSGGMKQKLGLACCLIHDPEILLLDEPTNGVDPVSRREFWKILYDLLSEGVSIVVSTAYLDEAERCNRVAFMYRGSILFSGSPEEIKGSMAGHFIEVIADDAVSAEREIRAYDQYRGVILTGGALRMFVRNVPAARRDIGCILRSKNIRMISCKTKRPALEDCFVHMVAGKS